MVVALAHNIFVRFSLDISARYAKYASSCCRAPSWAALTERTTTSRDARGVSRLAEPAKGRGTNDVARECDSHQLHSLHDGKCLNGTRYYEWLKKGKERLPHFTKRQDGQLMLLAGLYDRAQLEGESEPLWTFTIVTTDANKDFQWLHDRQPVILSSVDALNAWLDTSSQQWAPQLTKLVEPYHDSEVPLACYQVPKEVGKVGTESPTFIQPIAGRKDGIQAMFAKQAATTSSQQSDGAKRKRSASPKSPASTMQEKKEETKLPANKLNTWEDDSEIEYVDGPSSADKQPKAEIKQDQSNVSSLSSTPKKRARTEAKSPKSATPKKRQTKHPESAGKITAFFGRT